MRDGKSVRRELFGLLASLCVNLNGRVGYLVPGFAEAIVAQSGKGPYTLSRNIACFVVALCERLSAMADAELAELTCDITPLVSMGYRDGVAHGQRVCGKTN
jgi:hypothetical protein